MDEGYLGQIMLFAGIGNGWPPEGWMLCDGQKLSIIHNMALFSILGTEHGGNGSTYFQLPKLPPVGNCPYIICVVGHYPRRS